MAPGPRQAKMWKMWGELWEPALRRLSKCGNICSCLLLQRLGQYVPHFWVSLLPRCLELRGFARRSCGCIAAVLALPGSQRPYFLFRLFIQIFHSARQLYSLKAQATGASA